MNRRARARPQPLREAQKGGKSFGEEDLEGHLATETAKPQEEDEEGMAKQLELDPQLTRAVELLKSWSIFSHLQEPGSV